MSAERSDDHGARRRLMKQLLAVSLVMTMLGLAVLPVTAQPVTIGVSLPQDDNPFYIAMLKGIRARAQELGGVERDGWSTRLNSRHTTRSYALSCLYKNQQHDSS